MPDQHGAWVMVAVPFALGVDIAGPRWIHLPLWIAWLVGYFAFFAFSLWLKARGPRKAELLKPLAVYGTICAVAAVVVLVQAPWLLYCAGIFAPLIAIAVWEVYAKRPRSLLSGESTVLASCAMIPVTSWVVGQNLTYSQWWMTAVVTAYFCGTIPYVKTLIRNRGDKRWLWGSIAYHFCVVVLAAVSALSGGTSWFLVVVLLGVAFRSWWFPYSGARRGKPWPPKVIGQIEGLVTLAVIIAAVWGI